MEVFLSGSNFGRAPVEALTVAVELGLDLYPKAFLDSFLKSLEVNSLLFYLPENASTKSFFVGRKGVSAL